jgi:uncharacterized protein (TIGR03437 family)
MGLAGAVNCGAGRERCGGSVVRVASESKHRADRVGKQCFVHSHTLDGKVNSQDNPATAGSVIAFYAIGLGQVDPLGIDGQAAN